MKIRAVSLGTIRKESLQVILKLPGRKKDNDTSVTGTLFNRDSALKTQVDAVVLIVPQKL